MQLARPFIRLALAVDADRLRAEVAGFAPADWRAHPQGHAGNTALPLIARHGRADDDGVAGPMQATPLLARCPYLRQVLAALDAPLGRTRLMQLDAGAEATAHVDTNYYWLQRVRVHLPITTTPGVRFLCGDAETHMAPGEAWLFDTWRQHNVINPPQTSRTHLVIDTVGSAGFWALARPGAAERNVRFHPGAEAALEFETVNFPVVMSPYEFGAIWSGWRSDAVAGGADASRLAAFDADMGTIIAEWRARWAAYGERAEGWPAYAAVLEALRSTAARHRGAITLPNRMDLAHLVLTSLIPALHSPDLASGSSANAAVPDLGQASIAMPSSVTVPADVPAANATVTRPPEPQWRPLIVVCAPRSGSTLLFEQLAACSPDWVSVGNESHLQIEGVAALQPARRGYDSNVLTASDAADAIAEEVRARFAAAIRDRNGNAPARRDLPLYLLEKTPKNALRVPFLAQVFPLARFLYLWREPEQSLASLVEGWNSGRFVMYPDLPAWPGPPWSYLLVPGWRQLAGQPLPAIVAAQWRITQERALQDLERLAPERVRALAFDAFLADPERSLRSICAFAGVAFDRPPPRELPLSMHTVTPPAHDKWRLLEGELAPWLPALAPVSQRARRFLSAQGLREEDAPVTAAATRRAVNRGAVPATDATAEPMASVHTSNLPGILKQLRASIAITTYQTGHVILARPDGTTLNTHFAPMRKPMGVATDGARLFIGTETGVREYRNIPDLTGRLEPPGRHDAVYVLRNQHITGDIDIHEIALTDAECWYVNTRFSCLCTLDHDHSFVPRWRPRFVTSLAPEDRCHLNGLAMVDGAPGYLTALGATDAPQGWRANKKDGGVVLDYASREVVASGLSMPHSPRWHNGRLWVLESGRGSLGTVDLSSGKVETVARVPGFTRGLDVVGSLAFIGLSQLRETNAFTDIPLTEANRDRMSGVWVVNLETGQTVAYLKFSRVVQEIFGVALLRNALFPMLLDDDDVLLKSTYILPDAALREVRYATPATAAEGSP